MQSIARGIGKADLRPVANYFRSEQRSIILKVIQVFTKTECFREKNWGEKQKTFSNLNQCGSFLKNLGAPNQWF